MTNIYYNDVMKLFGDNYVNIHGFNRVYAKDLKDVDELLWFGIYDGDDYEAFLECEANIHLHWCGSDVLFHIDSGTITDIAQKRNCTHTCENNLQQGELAPYGIKARIAPMFSESMNDYMPENEYASNNIVVVYAPGRKELYNTNLMEEVAKELPDFQFHFIGADTDIKPADNIMVHGKIPQEQVKTLLSLAHIYLRITEHDALPDLVVKSILMQKHVIFNHRIPFINYAYTKDEIIAKIKELKDKEASKEAEWFYRTQFINKWDVILDKVEAPKIDVCILNGRGQNSWFAQAVDSAYSQTWSNLGILVLDNTENQLSIGAGFNKLAESSDADYIFFLGDDDYISNDLVSSSINALLEFSYSFPNTVQCSSFITSVDENNGILGFTPVIPTGLWNREWLVRNKFDENLKKLVDTELLNRVEQKGYSKVIMPYHFGYFYRQHSNMVSGRKGVAWNLDEALEKMRKDKMKEENNGSNASSNG